MKTCSPRSLAEQKSPAEVQSKPWFDQYIECLGYYESVLWNIAGGQLPMTVAAAGLFVRPAIQMVKDRQGAQASGSTPEWPFPPDPHTRAQDLAFRVMMHLSERTITTSFDWSQETHCVEILAERFLPGMFDFLSTIPGWPAVPFVERDHWQREAEVAQRTSQRLRASGIAPNMWVLDTLAHSVRWHANQDLLQVQGDEEHSYEATEKMRKEWHDDIIVADCPICGSLYGCFKADPETWRDNAIAAVGFLCPDCGLRIPEAHRILAEEFGQGRIPADKAREFAEECGLVSDPAASGERLSADGAGQPAN